MTALTVCLGARASSTQRATSLESLIKEGSAEARVIVKISNCGALRFKYDIYGNSILIERRFKRNGPNSFKIKSGESGKIVSDRKDEVIAICDNYNIQVENPLSVLTQETAKKFLVNSSPQDLYEFFMRATQLEQLSFDYAYSLDRMKSIQNSLNDTKRSWSDLEEKIENLRVELKSISEQKQLAQKMNELNAEILWAKIDELESDAREIEELITSYQNIVISNNESIDLMSQKSVENKAQLKLLDAEITKLYSKKKPIISEVGFLERRITESKENLRQNEIVSREINSNVTKLKDELNQIDKKLEESLKDSDSERSSKANQVLQLEEEVQENNRRYKEIDQQIAANYSELREMESNLENATKTYDMELRISKDLTRELDKAKAECKDRLQFFGENLPEVMKELENKRKEFKFIPIGPIGMHVKLLEQKWSLTMDAIIGSHMRSFITHHHEDRILLDSIFRKHKCINPIINLSNEPIDIHEGEPDNKFLTALRALKIGNESVKKALIVFSSIERIVLIENSAEARETMMSRLRTEVTV